MTAEVAILNTHGVAIAVDSAVTVLAGGEKKVYNTANKLFTLSKYHPVGIMVYNNAAYMGIDWEIIIKEFRKTLKNKPYNTLFDYADTFVKYVKEFEFITAEQQKNTLFSICYNIILLVRNSFIRAIKYKFNTVENITQGQTIQVLSGVIKNIQDYQEKLVDKTNYTLDVVFIEQYKNNIFEMIDDIFGNLKLTINQKESLYQIIIVDLNKAHNLCNISGIVIAGYGYKEIFPSIYQCEIIGKIGKSFILFNEEKDSISYEHTASIVPFAQKEMVQMFMSGIDPLFQETIDKRLSNFVMSIVDVIGDKYKDSLKKVKNEFIENLIDFQQNVYINPIMDIVQSLQKLDLADMAETLVNLTAFKRHISKDAETVGGPTDVAVITKGDGFVWIKRKHYFDIKFNQSFQQKYFMEDANEEGL
jgi:hypothetical protein